MADRTSRADRGTCAISPGGAGESHTDCAGGQMGRLGRWYSAGPETVCIAKSCCPTILGPRTVGPFRRSWGQTGDPGAAVEAFVSDCAGPKTTARWWTRSSESRATENRASMRERVSETGEIPTRCPGTSLRLSSSLCSVPTTSCLPLSIARVRRKATHVPQCFVLIPHRPRPYPAPRILILVGRVSAGRALAIIGRHMILFRPGRKAWPCHRCSA